MTSVGPGVREIREREKAGISRMIYLATRAEGLYGLYSLLPVAGAATEPVRSGIRVTRFKASKSQRFRLDVLVHLAARERAQTNLKTARGSG